MSDENVLTVEIAEEYVHDDESVDLEGFDAIQDAAAAILSESECELGLELSGLKTLSDTAAESLSKYDGALFLDGLTNCPTDLKRTEGVDKPTTKSRGIR